MCSRARTADPAVAAVGCDRAAEAPAGSLEEQRGLVPLLLRQMVRRHQANRTRRQDPCAVCQQHSPEAVAVAERRDEAAGPRGEDRRLRPRAVLDRRQVGRTVFRQPVELLRGDVKAGVGDPEWLEDSLGEERRQRPARGAGDQHTLDVGARVVEPRLAWLAEHRYPGERREPFVRRFSRPEHRELLEELRHSRQGEVGGKAPAGAEGQDVLDRDRAFGRHDVVDRALRRPHDLRRRQLGQPPRNRVGERHAPLVHQDHDRGSGDRFCDRSNPDDRIGLNLAGRCDLDVLAMPNECGGARHRPAFDERLEEILEGSHRRCRPRTRPELVAAGSDEFPSARPSNRQIPTSRRYKMSKLASKLNLSQVGRVCVTVADTDRAIGFYVDTLGFEKVVDVPMGDAGRWVEVALPGTVTTIALAPPPQGQEAGGSQTGICLDTSDVDADHTALKAAGVDVDDEVARWGGPVPPMFWLRDPDGNSLIVVEPSS